MPQPRFDLKVPEKGLNTKLTAFAFTAFCQMKPWQAYHKDTEFPRP